MSCPPPPYHRVTRSGRAGAPRPPPPARGPAGGAAAAAARGGAGGTARSTAAGVRGPAAGRPTRRPAGAQPAAGDGTRCGGGGQWGQTQVVAGKRCETFGVCRFSVGSDGQTIPPPLPGRLTGVSGLIKFLRFFFPTRGLFCLPHEQLLSIARVVSFCLLLLSDVQISQTAAGKH